MGVERFFYFLESIGEKTFILLGVLTLPIWFPIIALFVIFDPTYRIRIWQNRNFKQPTDGALLKKN